MHIVEGIKYYTPADIAALFGCTERNARDHCRIVLGKEHVERTWYRLELHEFESVCHRIKRIGKRPRKNLTSAFRDQTRLFA